MAKRGLVGRMFFVYDHTALQKEEDDLKDAIVYFYPPNVPEDDQCALCGQLMGMVSFFQATWSAKPSVYQLASHKFVLKHVEEKYTLALGGERSVSEHCLERQLHLLYSTFSMYKGSLRAIRQNCESRGVSFYETVAPIWECFLPFCCAYGDDVRRGFLSLPTVELPKSGADIFLQASAMLQASKRRPGVLGGAVLSSNSVLCTQLSEDLTSRILVIKPQQAHLPCEPVHTDFPLPVGVRIISVYISHSDYAKLSPRGNQSQQMHTRMSRFKPGRGSALSEEPPPYNFVVASSKSQFRQPQNHDEDFSEFAQNESSVNVCIGSVPSLGCQSDVAKDRSNHANSHEHSDSHGNQGMPKSSFSDNVNCLKERTTESAKSDQPADPLSSDSDSNERQNSLGQKSNNSSTTHCIAADVHFDGTSFDDAKPLVSDTSINETCYISQSVQEESEENKAATCEPQSQSDQSILNLCSAKSQTLPESEMVRPDSEENSPESHDNGTVLDQLHEADSENVTSNATVSENVQNVKDNKSSSKKESCEDETLRQERDLSQLDGLNDEIQTEKSGEIHEAVSLPKSIYERGESKLNSLSGECPVKSNENNGESVDGTDCLTHDLDVTAGSESRTQGSTKNSKNSGAMEIVEKTNSAENELTAEETDIHAACSVDNTVHTVSEKKESEVNNYLNKEVVLSESQLRKSDTDVIDSVLCAFPHNQTSHESAQTVSMSHSECNVHIPMQSDTEGLMTDEQHRTTQGRNGYCVEKHDSKEDENLNSNVSSLVTNSADSAISVSEILVSDDFDHVNKAGFGALTPPASAADKRLLSSTDTSSAQDENKETFVFAVDQSVSSEAQDSVPGMRLLKPSMKLNTLASVSPIPTSVSVSESNTQISHVPHSTFKGLQQEAVNVTLYIQGHSDSMLILFMEEQSRHDKETVQALWKLALPQLGDLDYRVKEFIKEEIPRPAHEDYYYLKFNDFQRQVSGNVTKPVTSGECEFCDLSVDMHEEFRKSPSVTDLCIRTHRASVYGHRSVNHEVFFQSVSKHHQTNGLPFAKDVLFSLDQISQRKLYKNHNITFV